KARLQTRAPTRRGLGAARPMVHALVEPQPQEAAMHAIKIHLEPAEHAVISRFARALQVSPEDIAYAALDQLMIDAQTPEVQRAVKECCQWRKNNLPLWADTERS